MMSLDIPCSLSPAVAILELTGIYVVLVLPTVTSRYVSVERELDCGHKFLWGEPEDLCLM